jgi:hypothetical protein
MSGNNIQRSKRKLDKIIQQVLELSSLFLIPKKGCGNEIIVLQQREWNY